jgi:malonyl-CoA O-methyltransferase
MVRGADPRLVEESDMNEHKGRIASAFTAQADVYDAAADLQWLVAERLSEQILARIKKAPQRILEIGCGTGFLSARLADAFPEVRLTLTDIAPTMLARCRARVGDKHDYKVLDGERPDGLSGQFDLIASNLAFQWFVDLPGALTRLAELLAPGGQMIFATLGHDTFTEWRRAHQVLDLACGTPTYPKPETFPWPAPPFSHDYTDEKIRHPYADGRDFVNSLKLLGASEPEPGYRPLSPGAMRKLLASLSGGFEATYHVIYGEIRR